MKNYSTDPKIKQALNKIHVTSIVGLSIFMFLFIVFLVIGISIAVPNSADTQNNTETSIIIGIVIIIIGFIFFLNSMIFANNLIRVWRLSKSWTSYHYFLINAILMFVLLNWIFAIIMLFSYRKINQICANN